MKARLPSKTAEQYRQLVKMDNMGFKLDAPVNGDTAGSSSVTNTRAYGTVTGASAVLSNGTGSVSSNDGLSNGSTKKKGPGRATRTRTASGKKRRNQQQSQDQRAQYQISEYERQNALNNLASSYERLLQPIRNLYPHSHRSNVTSITDAIMQNYNNLNQHHIKTNPRLTNKPFNQKFQTQMRQLLNGNMILFSIDIEAWEMENKTVTEIGIAIYDPRRNVSGLNVVPVFTKLHIRIMENMHRVNGKFVVDHAVNFVGEPTLILSMRDLVILIQSLFDYFFKPSSSENDGLDTYLVGHGVSGDIKWLSSIGIEFPTKYLTLDTLDILKITHGNHHLGLGAALKKLDLPHVFLHNAGNDAYYTLLLVLKLMDPGVRTCYELDLCLDKELMMSKEEKEAMKEAKRVEREQRKEAKELRKKLLAEGIQVPVDEKEKEKRENKKKKKKAKLKQNHVHNVALSVYCSASDAVLYVFAGKTLPGEEEEVGGEEKEGSER